MRPNLCALLFLLFTVNASAAVPPGLVEAFRPLDGVIVRITASEVLIDLGSSSGLREGELVAVLDPGEELKHPVSGASLGRIEQARAFLRSERVKPDFAWARNLTPQIYLRPGETVRRFGEVPAVFVDERGDSHPLFAELQLALPHLAWRPWGETELSGPGLRFIAARDALVVRDETGTLLGSWPTSGATPGPLPVPPPTQAQGGTLSMIEHTFKGKAVGVVVTDLDADGSREIALAFAETLVVGRLRAGIWTPLATAPLPAAVKALALESCDLDADGRPELLLSAVRGGNELAAQVWSLDAGQLRLMAKNLPWFLRVLDLPGKGLTPLGQAGGRATDALYEGHPFRLLWRDGSVQAGAPFPLPAPVTLHGSQPLTTEKGVLWAWLDDADRLNISDAAGKHLWRGSDTFGGNESYLEGQESRRGEPTRRRYLRSGLARSGEVLIVPQNEGSRALDNWRKAEKSRLVALRWNGVQLEEVWKSPTRDGYLADFAFGDADNDGSAEFLLAGTLASGLLGGSESALFLWRAAVQP